MSINSESLNNNDDNKYLQTIINNQKEEIKNLQTEVTELKQTYKQIISYLKNMEVSQNRDQKQDEPPSLEALTARFEKLKKK